MWCLRTIAVVKRADALYRDVVQLAVGRPVARVARRLVVGQHHAVAHPLAQDGQRAPLVGDVVANRVEVRLACQAALLRVEDHGLAHDPVIDERAVGRAETRVVLGPAAQLLVDPVDAHEARRGRDAVRLQRRHRLTRVVLQVVAVDAVRRVEGHVARLQAADVLQVVQRHDARVRDAHVGPLVLAVVRGADRGRAHRRARLVGLAAKGGRAARHRHGLARRVAPVAAQATEERGRVDAPHRRGHGSARVLPVGALCASYP